MLHACSTIKCYRSEIVPTLQSKDLILATISGMVKVTVNRLVELKEQPESTTWFKDHATVFSDEAALGKKNHCS